MSPLPTLHHPYIIYATEHVVVTVVLIVYSGTDQILLIVASSTILMVGLIASFPGSHPTFHLLTFFVQPKMMWAWE